MKTTSHFLICIKIGGRGGRTRWAEAVGGGSGRRQWAEAVGGRSG